MSIQEQQLQNLYDVYDYNNSIKKQIIDIIDHGLRPEVAEIKANEILSLFELDCDRCKKLEFMIENGLGWDDIKNDNS